MNKKLLDVVILAGGLAKRLHPLTKTLPKSLIPVNGEPFIAHQLRLLKNQGIERVVICTGFLGEMIQNYVKKGEAFQLHVTYSHEGEKLLGTAGAIKKALSLLDDKFFVLYGDSYLPCDYSAAQAAFIQSQKKALMTVFCNEGQWDKSNVEFRDGEIFSYEKINFSERMQYIDYGLGIFYKELFFKIPDNIPYDLADLYQAVLAEKQLAAFEIHQRFYEIGSFTGISELEQYFLCNS
ncbi:MAG TPA: nucleotidyltransferase family protein [Gammaproteobacteria bacterium]|nr:nucleotidyltransferase family protein [Gammaproteobacteria bacterium]